MKTMLIDKRAFCCGGLLIVLLGICSITLHVDMEIEKLCLVGIGYIVVALVLLWNRYKKFTGGMLYYVCLAFMHCGQMIILAFKMNFSDARKSSIALGNDYSYSNEAIRFVVLCLLVVAIIISFFEKDYQDDEIICDNYFHDSVQLNLTGIGWMVLGFLMMLTFVSDVIRIIQVSALGYGEGYRQTNTLLYYADLLFPLCTYIIISAYRENIKVIRRVFLLVVFRALVCALFIGSRSEAVLEIIIAAYAILKLTSTQEITKFVKRSLLVIGVSAVVLLPFTGLSRNMTSLTLSEFLETNNPITYSLTEFGGTIINVRLGIQYSGGLDVSEFFKSFASIIPMSGTFLPFLRTTYGNSYAAYLNAARGLGGLGGSSIGEAAFWFGTGAGGLIYVGIIAFIVIACMNALRNKHQTENIIRNATVLFLLYDVFYMIRGSVASLQGGIKIALYFWIILKLFSRYLFVENGTDEV